jgi:hypothetical protein
MLSVYEDVVTPSDYKKFNLKLPKTVMDEFKVIAKNHGHGAKAWAVTAGVLLLIELDKDLRKKLIGLVMQADKELGQSYTELMAEAKAGTLLDATTGITRDEPEAETAPQATPPSRLRGEARTQRGGKPARKRPKGA